MTVVLLIDAQRNMLLPPDPVAGAQEVAGTIAELLHRARAAGAAVVHVRNTGAAGDPDAPGSEGWQLVHAPLEGEPVIDKREPDAFAGTALERLLGAEADLVVAGMQSEHCVRATSLSALARGHRVTLVRGGHATYDGGRPAADTTRDVELELMHAGASVAGIDELALR
jgi:nicotinamidase-related amidase